MAILKIRDENGKITEVLAIKGENGVDGRTPVKGTDYWTEEDKQELANDIANRINVGTDKFALLSDFNTLNEEVINARDGEENLLTKLNSVVNDYQNVDNNLYDMIYPPSKNILRLPEYSISAEDNSGVAVTINENLISVEGTATEDIRLVFPIAEFVLPAGTYSYAIKNLNSDFTTGATIYIKDANYTNISNVFANQNVNYNKKVFTITEDKIIAHMSVTVTSGTEVKQTFNLQLEAGETSTDYVSPNERLFGGELTNDVDTLKLATVTASVFGAVGDGETDDTDALQRAIDYCSENYKVLKLESGKKYLISKILQFNGKSIYLDGNFATIKANKRLSSIDVTLSDGSTKTISPMIYVDCLNINDNFNTTLNEEQNYRMQVIKNLIIDCNGVVNDGIRAVRGRKVHIDNIVVINPVNNGIVINTGGWENMISNIHVSRYMPTLGGTGIYVEGSDNVIDKVVVIGCQYGIINVGGDNHYSHVHPWSTTKAMENLRNSVSFGCFGSYCTFTQCMGDSTNRIFEFKYNARAMISNCANTWSEGYVESADKNPYLFYFVDDEEGKNHTLRGKGAIVSTSYFKPKSSSDYPEFKTYFSNLSEDEEPILIDKVSEANGWLNIPKTTETQINSLSEYAKKSFVEEKIGDTEDALDKIIEIQNELLDGDIDVTITDYSLLENKPSINDVTLVGNITLEELGITDGKDGTSVTVQNISESTVDGGSNIVTFSDGKTLTVKNGSKGSAGEQGAKGDKGDRGEKGDTGTVQAVPLFANSTEECTDTTKLYVLPDGYIYGFMTVETVGGTEEVTEQITGEFTEDYRLSTSSGSLSALAGAITTPLIDITRYGDKFTIHLDSANGGSTSTVQWAKANQNVTGNSICLYKDDDLVLAGYTGSTSLNGITYNVNAADDVDISFDVSAVPIDAQGFTHVRFSGVTGRADKVAVSVTYEKEIQGGLKPDFINLADPTSDSWKNGYRINSSLQYVEANGACTTNWFPCKTGSVIRVKGLAMARVGLSTGGIEVGGYSGLNASADGITPIVNEKASEDHVYQLFSRDADGVETIDLTNYTSHVGTFNYVCLTGRVENTEEDIIITVDEEIKYSQEKVYEWTNTGHAFVPADYENRIIDLEDDVTDLKNTITTSNGVPVYVIEEAEAVADKILATRNAHSFVFGAISDTHTTGSDTSATSVLHAGMGINAVNEFTQLDLVLNFGDVMVGYLDDTYKEGFKHVKSAFNSVAKAVPYIQMQGNHDQLSADTTEEAQQKYFAYIGANNVGTVTDWTNRFRNYGYRDFDDQKMRVIYLNTTDVSEVENTKDVGVSAEQYSWFINTALDFSNKDDAENWGFIICSHHPLNWYYLDNLLVLLNAYKGKTSGSISVDNISITYDFTNATAELIAHFHGHLHNFRVEKLGKNEITTITIPNACFGRNNEYGTNSSYNETVHTNFGDADENGNQRQFNKTANTAKDTAFNIVVVDRQNKRIHCFNYGAGIDRTIEVM